MLTDDQVTFFRKNGFLSPLRIIEKNDAVSLRELYHTTIETDLRAKVIEDGNVGLEDFEDVADDPHLYFKWVADLVFNPKLVNAVQALLGPNVVIWETRFFTKKAQTPDFISWHQDLKYWKLNDGCEEVTAWIALSPSTEKSGCMRVVPGSHKLELVDHTQTFADENMLSRGQEIAVDVDENDAVSMSLSPGEMSLHHGKIFHASHPNQSNDDRIGLAIRCLPTSAQQTFGKGVATLLCGTCPRTNFHLVEPASNNTPTFERIRKLNHLYAKVGSELAN
ncbi:MAG: phytanoyl-CoA dioxygenase family protein [Pseudomonadota bacterium]